MIRNALFASLIVLGAAGAAQAQAPDAAGRGPGGGNVIGGGLIRNPLDQFDLGHQWKSVCGLMAASSRRRQRAATAASSASKVAKCWLTTASSTSGQRCSAGCGSGL